MEDSRAGILGHLKGKSDHWNYHSQSITHLQRPLQWISFQLPKLTKHFWPFLTHCEAWAGAFSMPGVARGFSLLKLAGSSGLLGWSGRCCLKILWQLRPPRQITIISVRVLMMMFFSVELIRLAFSASIVCFYRGTFGNTELKWCLEWSSWLYKIIIFLFLDITKQSRSFTLENEI